MTVAIPLTGRPVGFAVTGQPSASATATVENLTRLEHQERWHLAQRIAASKGFAKSKFLTHFILYICEKQLLDQAGEITEQQIGERVFRRPQGYNPGEDNIVRNYARLLRQRLEEYFANEGKSETTRIVVPRGGYVPLFVEDGMLLGESAPEFPQENPLSLPSRSPNFHLYRETSSDSRPITRSSRALRILCAALFLALAVLLFRDLRPKPRATPTNRFWSTFFSPVKDTLVVPADSGLVIYQNLTKTRISLADYVGGEYQKRTHATLGIDTATVNELGARRYTSVVDLNLVSAISLLPEVVKNRFKVRYAREVTLDDLKESNVVLSGSFDANPWVELFQKDLNFQFEHMQNADSPEIRNLHPLPGERSTYATDEADPARNTFGVIAVTRNLDSTGYVLIIEGLNMAGTQAAADYLFSEVSKPLIDRIFDSDGKMQPFEVLLETSNIGANAAHPHIISLRIEPKR
ncbi:hypothetical protein [Granulicella sp. S190]|uniref:hypothetical protein n=1 Tax=Granulicella sp. S190 TaxID=1747226 RepID=UPI0020B16FAC|nr:hypothetical protein [Granulicella sp. S190]